MSEEITRLEDGYLSGLIDDNSTASRCPMSANHFPTIDRREIFEACSRLIAAGKIADAKTLSTELQGNAMVQPNLLVKLTSPDRDSAASAPYFAEKLRELAIRRELVHLADTIKGKAADGSTTPATFIEEARHKLDRLAADTQFGTLTAATESITEQAIRNWLRCAPEGIPTRYAIEGEQIIIPAGALTLICGATGHGKTAMLLNLFTDFAKAQPDQRFYFLTYEEAAEELAIKALSVWCGAKYSADNLKSIKGYLRDGHASHFAKVESGGAGFADFAAKAPPFWAATEAGRLTIAYTNQNARELINTIRHLAAAGKAGAIFIDYVQLLRTGDAYGSRQEELKSIVLSLKDAAVSTGLPIVLGAQFNRQVVNAPAMHATAIGEAGDVERACNLVLGLWNGSKLPHGDKPAKKDHEALEIQPDELYVKILKSRDGRSEIDGKLSWCGSSRKIEPGRRPEGSSHVGPGQGVAAALERQRGRAAE